MILNDVCHLVEHERSYEDDVMTGLLRSSTFNEFNLLDCFLFSDEAAQSFQGDEFSMFCANALHTLVSHQHQLHSLKMI